MVPPLIRPATPSDASAISALLPDLGYPASESEVSARLAALAGWPDRALFVAELDGELAGLCQIQGMRLIAGDGYAEVHALVVTLQYQRKGLGSALIRHALQWAAANGHQRVRLRSGLHREGAHRFYESLGFERAKASFAFELSV